MNKIGKNFVNLLISFFVVLAIVLVWQISKSDAITSKADEIPNISLSGSKLGVFAITSKSAAKDMGVAWTRIPISWENWETYKVKGTKPAPIKVLDGLDSNTKIIVTLTTIHPTKTKCTNSSAVGIAACPPNNLDEYKTFIKDIVTTYKDKVAVWQLGNEVYRSPLALKFWDGPFDDANQIDFIDIFQAGAETIKQIIPNAKIASPGVNFGSIDFQPDGTAIRNEDSEEQQKWDYSVANFNKFISKECSNINMVDVHLYHTTESTFGRVKWAQKTLQSAKCNRSIIATEVGGPNPKPNTDLFNQYLKDKKAFEKEQAKELPIRLSDTLEAGADTALWFYYKDFGTTGDFGNKLLGQFGLVDKKDRKKPAYQVLQVVTGVKSLGQDISDNGKDKNKSSLIDKIIGIIVALDGSGSDNSSPDTTGGTTTPPSPSGDPTITGVSPGGGTLQTPTISGVGNYGKIGAQGAAGKISFIPFIKAKSPAQVIATIFRIVFMLAAAVFLVLILAGGLSYMLSAGNEEGAEKAKKIMINGIIGLLIILSAYAFGTLILRVLGFRW